MSPEPILYQHLTSSTKEPAGTAFKLPRRIKCARAMQFDLKALAMEREEREEARAALRSPFRQSVPQAESAEVRAQGRKRPDENDLDVVFVSSSAPVAKKRARKNDEKAAGSSAAQRLGDSKEQNQEEDQYIEDDSAVALHDGKGECQW